MPKDDLVSCVGVHDDPDLGSQPSVDRPLQDTELSWSQHDNNHSVAHSALFVKSTASQLQKTNAGARWVLQVVTGTTSSCVVLFDFVGTTYTPELCLDEQAVSPVQE